MIITILFIICLFLTVWMMPINLMKFKRGRAIPFANFFWQAVGITGIILYILWKNHLI